MFSYETYHARKWHTIPRENFEQKKANHFGNDWKGGGYVPLRKLSRCFKVFNFPNILDLILWL